MAGDGVDFARASVGSFGRGHGEEVPTVHRAIVKSGCEGRLATLSDMEGGQYLSLHDQRAAVAAESAVRDEAGLGFRWFQRGFSLRSERANHLQGAGGRLSLQVQPLPDTILGQSPFPKQLLSHPVRVRCQPREFRDPCLDPTEPAGLLATQGDVTSLKILEQVEQESHGLQILLSDVLNIQLELESELVSIGEEIIALGRLYWLARSGVHFNPVH